MLIFQLTYVYSVLFAWFVMESDGWVNSFGSMVRVC